MAWLQGPAREGQVRDPVGAAPGLGTDVVDLQRHVRGAAIGALPSPLLEQVFPDLVAGEGPLLAFRARDLRVFQRLGVEPDDLARDGGHGRAPAQPLRPRGHVVDPRLQRGRELPAGAPVQEPLLPVAQVGRASAPPVVAPLLHGLFDPCSPVLDLGQEQDLAVLPHQRQAGGLRAGINLQLDLLRVSTNPVPEPDGEGMEPHHDGASLVQELSRPGRAARHQWVAAPVQDEDAAHAALGVARASPVTPAEAGLPSHNLTTRITIRPVSCLTRRVC